MRDNKMPEPWLSFFRDIDEKMSEQIDLECLGGFVITQLYGLARTTADVDIISVNPKIQSKILLELAGEGSVLHRKHKVYLDLVESLSFPKIMMNG
jgi:hypothetical protein